MRIHALIETIEIMKTGRALRLLKKSLWLLPSLLAITLYLQCISHTYISFDDPGYTYEVPMVVSGLSWEGIVWSFSDSHFANYHPLTWISFMLDFSVFGDAPGWFAVENAVWHSLNTLLVSILLARVLGSKGLGLIGGVIFATHPVLVEAVAWISQRKTLLSSFWALMSVLLYLYQVEVQKNHRKRFYLQVGSLLCFGVSLLSKSMYVTLPALLLLLELATCEKGRGIYQTLTVSILKNEILPLVQRLLPYALISLFFSVLAYWSQDKASAVTIYPFLDRVENVIFGYSCYLLKFFYPIDLGMFYPFRFAPDYSGDLIRVASMLILSGLLYRFRNLWGIVPLMGWFFFLIALLPVVGLVQIGAQSHADRYLYGPIFGLILMLVSLGSVLFDYSGLGFRRILLRFSIAGWFIFLSVVCWFQVAKWKNDFTIAYLMMESDPDNLVASQLMATFLLKHGELEKAKVILEKQKNLYPNFSQALCNLALCEYLMGNLDLALEYQTDYVNHNRESGKGLVTLAGFYVEKGMKKEAAAIVQDICDKRMELTLTEQGLLEGVQAKLTASGSE